MGIKTFPVSNQVVSPVSGDEGHQVPLAAAFRVSNQVVSPASGDSGLCPRDWAWAGELVSNQVVSPASGDGSKAVKVFDAAASFQSSGVTSEW